MVVPAGAGAAVLLDGTALVPIKPLPLVKSAVSEVFSTTCKSLLIDFVEVYQVKPLVVVVSPKNVTITLVTVPNGAAGSTIGVTLVAANATVFKKIIGLERMVSVRIRLSVLWKISYFAS
ncbi:MAG TPA: hypothetical protein VIK72_01860 [Clostridiaceae bacterium]